MIRFAVLAAAILCGLILGPSIGTAEPAGCTVDHVIDGDTFGAEIARVIAAIDELAAADGEDTDATVEVGADDGQSDIPEVKTWPLTPASTPESAAGPREWVNREQAALIDGLNAGHSSEEDVFRYARDRIGSRLLPRSSVQNSCPQ